MSPDRPQDPAASPSLWLFQANPAKFDFLGNLAKHGPGDEDEWLVTRYRDQMHVGDRVLIWVAGSDGGIYAEGTLSTVPELQDGTNPYPTHTEAKASYRVRFRYDRILARPLRRREITDDPELADLLIIRQPTGTNYRLEPSQWERIQELLDVVGEPDDSGGLDDVLPKDDPQARAILTQWLADAITHAHAQSPSCWVLTHPKGPFVRLLIGATIAFESGKGRIGVGLHMPSVPAAVLAEIENDTSQSNFAFARVDGGVNRRLSVARFLAHRDLLRPAALRFIELAAAAYPRTHFSRYHAPDLIEELGGIVGARLPTPLASETSAAATERRPAAAQTPAGKTAGLSFADLRDRLVQDGLQFPEDLVAAYLLALQAKRFVILSGISGTGKTQLALAVAKAFQPAGAVATASTATDTKQSDGLRLRVQPYMLKFHRMVVPRTVAQSITADASSGRIQVHFDGDRSESLRWSAQSTATQLLFKGPFREWFDQTFAHGDEFVLRVQGEDPSHLRIDPITTIAAPPPTRQTYEVVAVRPDWTDSRGLLGYCNPITREYHPTPLLRLVLAAAEEQARAEREARAPAPYFLVLDEMNLARVEHYFSDFLSCLESGEPLHLHDDPLVEAGESDTAEAVPRRLSIPDNLFFTGTVNVDETTSMFSPKVLDRAFVLEFNKVDLARYGATEDEDSSTTLRLSRFSGALEVRRMPAAQAWSLFRELLGGALHRALVGLNERLEPDHRHFGYRVANEIARFVELAAQQASPDAGTLWEAFDIAVIAKVLPKLHGTQQEIEEVLASLLAYAVDVNAPIGARTGDDGWLSVRAPRLPRAAAKLWRMLKRARQQGYVSFIE